MKRVEGNEGALVRNGGKDLGSREVVVAMTYGCRVPSFFSGTIVRINRRTCVKVAI